MRLGKLQRLAVFRIEYRLARPRRFVPGQQFACLGGAALRGPALRQRDAGLRAKEPCSQRSIRSENRPAGHLTDKTYCLTEQNLLSTYDVVTGQPGRPREFSLSLRKKLLSGVARQLNDARRDISS
jgi:hypothetical protein